MADQSFNTVSTDWQAEQRRLQQQQRLAEALTAQGQQSLQGGMVGNIYVQPSFTQGLAKLANALSGRLVSERASEKEKDLATRRSEAIARALGDIPQAQTTSTTGAGMTGGLDSQDYQPGAAPGDTQTTQPTQADYGKFLGNLAGIGPDAVQIGSTMIGMQQGAANRAEDRAFRQQEAKAAREARAQELQLRLQDQRIQGAERAALQRELAQMNLDARREIAAMSDATRRDVAEMARAQGAKPPPGYRMTPDGNLEAIPGGPADLKMQGAFNQDTAALTGGIGAMDRLATAANEAMNHPGLAGVTGLRGALPNIPGSAAADAQAKLNTLKSQVAFGVLQDMRNNSKTGGALGAVSDAEGKRLEANLAALENAQSYEQMKESLKKIIDYTSGAKDRLQGAFNLKHQGATPKRRATDNAAPPVDALLEKYK